MKSQDVLVVLSGALIVLATFACAWIVCAGLTVPWWVGAVLGLMFIVGFGIMKRDAESDMGPGP